MAYEDSKLSVIIPLIIAKLKTDLTLTDATCFEGDSGDDLKPNPGQIYYVVYRDGGRFDDALWAGGGREQLTADAIFGVRIVSKLHLDQPGHHGYRWAALDAAMNLVLGSLAAYEPTSGSTTLVREVLQPLDFVGPRKVAGKKDLGEILLRFGCLFDWDLS